MRPFRFLLALGALATLAASPALAITITACQEYGDVPFVDLNYTGRDSAGNTHTALTEPVWADSADTSEITFPSVPVTLFTFNSLNLRNFLGTGDENRIHVVEGSRALLSSIDTLNVAPGPRPYCPRGDSGPNGPGDGGPNGPIDDDVVTAEAPEPGSMLLLGVGLGALGLRRRRSR